MFVSPGFFFCVLALFKNSKLILWESLKNKKQIDNIIMFAYRFTPIKQAQFSSYECCVLCINTTWEDRFA